MKSIAHYNTQVLKPLVERVAKLRELQKLLYQQLPPELRDNCHIANMESGILKIAVASPAWAMRLRYLIPDLLSALRSQGFPHLSSIEYYVEAEFAQLFKS